MWTGADPAASASPWIAAHADLVPSGTEVLDVAAGGGRHSALFLQRGHPVTAVDVLTDDLPHDVAGLTVVTADLEADPWPFPGRTFGAVVVCNYLHRPLLPVLVDAVAPGGVLLYDTFMVGQERLGHPRNPNFLLRPGELRRAVAGHLEVHDAAEGLVEGPRPAQRQAIAAVRRG